VGATDIVEQKYQLVDSKLPQDDPYTPWLQRQYCLVYCFNMFSNCFVVGDCRRLSVARGSGRLAETSATYFLCAFSRLLVAEPTSTIIGDLRQRYKRVFLPHVHLQYPSYPFVVNAIHHLFFKTRPYITRTRYNPSFNELVPSFHADNREI